MTVTKADIGGSAWVEVTGEPAGDLWAFDFSPYVTNPAYFLVKIGNGEFTHYLFENKAALQYGVIDLQGINPRRGNITIDSVSHTTTAGTAVNVPEPASLSLMLLGIAGAAAASRKKRGTFVQ